MEPEDASVETAATMMLDNSRDEASAVAGSGSPDTFSGSADGASFETDAVKKKTPMLLSAEKQQIAKDADPLLAGALAPSLFDLVGQ